MGSLLSLGGPRDNRGSSSGAEGVIAGVPRPFPCAGSLGPPEPTLAPVAGGGGGAPGPAVLRAAGWSGGVRSLCSLAWRGVGACRAEVARREGLGQDLAFVRSKLTGGVWDALVDAASAQADLHRVGAAGGLCGQEEQRA